MEMKSHMRCRFSNEIRLFLRQLVVAVTHGNNAATLRAVTLTFPLSVLAELVGGMAGTCEG